MSKIGYIRVSTEHQKTARQQEIMCDYQVDRIFSEKISGANKDRPQLHAMLDYVREGDTLYIESISRLGRFIGKIYLRISVALHREYQPFGALHKGLAEYHRHAYRKGRYPHQLQGEHRHRYSVRQIHVDRIRRPLTIGA